MCEFGQKFGDPTQKIWHPKNVKQLCNFIANISRMQQNIFREKMALQTLITLTLAYLLWSTNGKK